MEPVTVVLGLLVLQGGLGAIDTFVSHEWREQLPHQPWAVRELALHATRSTFFAAIFAGMAWFEWHGAWAWAMLAVMLVEYAVTTVDSIVEDRTRALSSFERTNHMLLALNTGLYTAFMLLQLGASWLRLPSGIVVARHPLWLALPLSACALGAAIWAVRDALASRRLRHAGAASPAARHGTGTDKRLSAEAAPGSENGSCTLAQRAAAAPAPAPAKDNAA